VRPTHPARTRLLEGKRLLVTGVVTSDSIAFAAAAAAQRAGATVVLSALPRDLEMASAVAGELPDEALVVAADLTSGDDLATLRRELGARLGHLDGAVHAIAFAPREALAGDFLSAGFEAVSRAFDASTHSYASLAALLRDLAPAGGGSLVGLNFDAAGAWPVYNWMGVCKAGLEAASRYVARDLGARRIRSNLVAAGPIQTRAASGIADFEQLTAAWAGRSPLAWDDRDSAPVADAVCFLLSDLARMVTGEIIHVDGGYHAMAGPLAPHQLPGGP
jgi:enoyl-[acyl-carrier protein] reductase I